MIQSLPALRQQFLAENQQFYEFAVDDPRKTHPLSLEQQKKRAKALLKSWRNMQEWELLQTHHPEAAQLTPETVQLADAQLVIARQNGFASWAKLKHYIETAALAKQALQSAQPSAPDADARTLHIRCGNDVMYKLAVAGFNGNFLSFADPYIQGPVPALSDQERFIHTRAAFIAGNDWRSQQQAVADLTGDYQALENGQDYARIAFWFEHDAYDVLIFLKMLHFFSNPAKRAPVMQFLCADHYPSVQRFNGIGQLPAEAMRVLWDQFQPLDDTQFEYGKLCWQAYTDSTPETFSRMISIENPPLPEIVPALQRHIRELPWLADGLSFSERITLQILADKGTQDAPNLFYHWYTCIYEPLPFMGDSSYWLVLEELTQAPQPAIHIHKTSAKKSDWQISLTTFGHKLLAGKTHWLEQNPYNRWWGGTHNHTDSSIWCWDETTKQVVCRL